MIYRIRAYFNSDIYPPRTYKRRTYPTLDAAKADYNDAVYQYSGYPYDKRFDKCVIECAQEPEWREVEE